MFRSQYCRPFSIIILFAALVSSAIAQFPAYSSFAVFKQLDVGTRSDMCIDAIGNTYVSEYYPAPPPVSYVSKVGPDGSVLYKAKLAWPVVGAVAPGSSGSVWVSSGMPGTTNSLALIDASGQATQINTPVTADAIASDSAGDVLVAGVKLATGTGLAVAKLDPSGKQLGLIQIASPNVAAQAIAVDGAGAIYITGNSQGFKFPTTPGAFQPANPTQVFGEQDVFVVKVSPTLDRVEWATMLGGVAASAAWAIAVDGAGNVYVGGNTDHVYAGMTPMSLNHIGEPLGQYTQDAFIVKLNPAGSAALYAVGLAPGAVNSIVVDARGRIHAEVADFHYTNAGVYTLSADGSTVERIQYVAGDVSVGFAGSGPRPKIVALPGGSGALRLLTSSQSANLPAITSDQPLTPVLIDLPAVPPQADLALSVSLAQPVVQGNGLVDLMATVTNNGPATAEGVQLWVALYQGPIINDSTVQPLSCTPSGIAICGSPTWIPNLAAGASLTIEFQYLANLLFGNPVAVAGLYSLTSDPNFANGFMTLAMTPVPGHDASISHYSAPAMFYYRSDAPHWHYSYFGGAAPATAAPSMTVWVPTPQSHNGNLWHFQSWLDGNTDNPRVFDATNGVGRDRGTFICKPERSIGADPPSLDLVALPGAKPTPQTVTLYPPVAVGTLSIGKPGAGWLSIASQGLDVASGTARVTGVADTTGLSPGYYRTSFPVTFHQISPNSSTTLNIPASLRIMTQAPAIDANEFLNVASGLSGPLSNWELISIRGTGLGPPVPAVGALSAAGELPTTLGGTSIKIVPFDAKLLYVSDREIIAMVPAVGYPSISLGGTPVLQLPLIDVAAATQGPGLFTADGSGKGHAWVMDANGDWQSSGWPVRRGSVISLLGTGLASRRLQSNGCESWQLNYGERTPTYSDSMEVLVGGVAGLVLSASSEFGQLCGIRRIDVLVPNNSPTGPAVPIKVGVPYLGQHPTDPVIWYWTQDGATIAVE
jgi:hypothetical protein